MRIALPIALVVLTSGLVAWPPLDAQTSGDTAVALKVIRMVDAQNGWASTINGTALLRTLNGGTEWHDVTPSDSSGQKIRVVTFHVLNSLVGWAGGAPETGGTNSRIFRTVDGGRTWASVGVQAREVTSISFINPREGWLLASLGVASNLESVEIHHSTDGGETWISVGASDDKRPDSGLPFTGDKRSITFLNSTTGWITGIAPGSDLYLFVTRDSGRTWRLVKMRLPPQVTPLYEEPSPKELKTFPIQGVILRVDYSLINASRESIGAVVVFYVSNDGGETWTYSVPARRVSDFYPSTFADMSHGWLMDGYSLYLTSDGGRRWTLGNLGSSSVSQLPVDVTQLDFVSPHLGWAIRKASPFLLKTVDGGRTWVPGRYTILQPARQ